MIGKIVASILSNIAAVTLCADVFFIKFLPFEISKSTILSLLVFSIFQIAWDSFGLAMQQKTDQPDEYAGRRVTCFFADMVTLSFVVALRLHAL